MRTGLRRLLASALLVGCGCSQSYDSRVDQFAKELERQEVIDEALKDPVGGKFSEVGMTLRPPKTLNGPKDFDLVKNLPPGQYDVEASFDSEPYGLHVLGRRKNAKPAAAKKDGAEGDAAETPAARGPFVADVTSLLNSTYADAASGQQPKPTRIGRSNFNRLDFKTADAVVQVYFYHAEEGADAFDAALIWEIAPNEVNKSGEQIRMCLETFKMGRPPRRRS